ncbi:MAG TPA: ATP-binding protein [Ktedonobacterales bacterium]|jgi:signal transduction histidine kinase/GAF domain-containing protein
MADMLISFDAQVPVGGVFAVAGDPLGLRAPPHLAAEATRRLTSVFHEQVERAARRLDAACCALYLVEPAYHDGATEPRRRGRSESHSSEAPARLPLALRALYGASWSQDNTRLGMPAALDGPAMLALVQQAAVPSRQADPPALQEWAQAQQVRRWLYVPIFGLAPPDSARARSPGSDGFAREYTDQARPPRVSLGVLAVGRHSDDPGFTSTETLLLSELGEYLALAIDHVRLTEQVEMGRELGRRYQEMAGYAAERERIIQELDEGVLLVAPFGRITHLNARGRELLGWPPGAGSFAGQARVQDYVPVEMRTTLGEVLLLEDWPMFQALRGERFTNTEVRYRGPDNHERMLVFSGRPLLDPQGKLEYALLSFHQASSEQAARAELALMARLADQRTQYVGSVLEAMNDSVLVCNQQGILLLVNLAGKRMLGIERARLLSRHYHMGRFVTDFQVRTLAGQPLAVEDFPLMQALRGETVHDVQLTLRQPDTGDEWQAHVSASPIKARGEGAPVVGAVAVLVDVTKARALDRAKDEFLAISAHELKGPLTSIRGFAQLLRRGTKQAPHGVERRSDMQWVEKIEAQADRLGRLIEELTDAARADLGKFDLKMRTTPLGALLRRVTEAQQVTTERHKITVEAPATGLFVQGDETRLEQVFSNLVANAIKYSPAGGDMTIVVSGLEDQPPAPFVEVAIRDQGQGIASGDLERIFTRFTRADPVRGVQGLGLGLYIARAIIEAHGGTIRVESEGLGRGSTFVVRLPREEPPRAGG